jgi:hypothetical protein
MVANANLNDKRAPSVLSTRRRATSWNVPLDELEIDHPSAAPATAPRPPRAVPNVTLASSTPTTSHWQQARPFVLAVGAVVATLLLYLLTSALVSWLGIKADDLQYGRPRTFQLDAYVGHNETSGSPTHFIAINLDHQVDIIELPGGDMSKARAISGPYLFGNNEDLTPVRLEVRDVNGDNKPDLLVNIKNEQVVYINSGSDFHRMTVQERADLRPAK